MTKCISIIIFILFTGLLSSIGFSQGAYLEQGVSGLELSGGYVSGKSVSGIGGTIGFSIAGTYDIRFSITKLSFDDEIGLKDLTGVAFSPQVIFHIVKQNSELPLSLALTAEYGINTHSAKTLDQLDRTLSTDHYGVGTFIFTNINASPTTYFQPMISYSYVLASRRLDYSSGPSDINTSHENVFGFAASLVLTAQQNTKIFIRPGINIGNDNTSYSIVVGFLPSFGL